MFKEIGYLDIISIIADVSQHRVLIRYLNKLEMHHAPTYIHSFHVAALSVQIGYVYGLSRHRLKTLAYGALLHDMGKYKIPAFVLDKKSKLSAEEYEQIKRHPLESYKLIHNHFSFEKGVSKEIVELICLMHHLKTDFSGYPDVSSDFRPAEIDYTRLPTECRIVTVSDIYDALVETRPYKPCFTAYEALEELRQLSSLNKVDGRFVDILEELILNNSLMLQVSSLHSSCHFE